MRRAQAILVLLALAALPLVPLVQASQLQACTCTRACCTRQGTDSANGQAHGKDYCQRQSARRLCDCGMMSRTALEFVLAPIPPALMSPLAVLAPPSVSLLADQQLSQHSSFGFSREVFEPPRG